MISKTLQSVVQWWTPALMASPDSPIPTYDVNYKRRQRRRDGSQEGGYHKEEDGGYVTGA